MLPAGIQPSVMLSGFPPEACGNDESVHYRMKDAVWRNGESDPLPEGLAQLDGYLGGLDLDTTWLVIFDRRKGQPPISMRTRTETATTRSGRTVIVIRG